MVMAAEICPSVRRHDLDRPAPEGNDARVRDDAAGHGTQGRERAKPPQGHACVSVHSQVRRHLGDRGGRLVAHRRERGPRPVQLRQLHRAHGDGQEGWAQGAGRHVVSPVRRQLRRFGLRFLYLKDIVRVMII